MSVKRRELVKYLVENGFSLLREGKKHSIYTNGKRTIPVKRHRILDRITANQLCKQAGVEPSSERAASEFTHDHRPRLASCRPDPLFLLS